MSIRTILFVISLLWSSWYAAAASLDVPTDSDTPLILQFNSNKASLDTQVKTSLLHAMEGFYPAAGYKIVVVGHTDSLGDDQENQHLSLQRAEAVRKEIIDALDLRSSSVFAIGKGEVYPIADNQKADGRASNRRVEIYLAHAFTDQVAQMMQQTKPTKSATEILIDKARQLVHKRQLINAMQVLAKALALGGDEMSSWHAVYGGAGIQAGLPVDKIRAHLNFALELNAHNTVQTGSDPRLKDSIWESEVFR